MRIARPTDQKPFVPLLQHKAVFLTQIVKNNDLKVRMSIVCTRIVLVCHSYVTRMYSYVILMTLVCTRMSSVCHSHVIRMSRVCTRMSLVCTRMVSVCRSYVLICHPYLTHMYSLVCCLP